MKVCTNPTCTIRGAQPLNQFHKRASAKDGRKSWCKTCARKYRQERYAKRREIELANAKKWDRDNPEHRKAIRHTRRTRQKRGGGVYTTEEWLSLKEKYNFTCLCCGRQEPDIKLTVDHILPVSKGGSNSISNIQPLCSSCNSSKKDTFVDYRKQYERD